MTKPKPKAKPIKRPFTIGERLLQVATQIPDEDSILSDLRIAQDATRQLTHLLRFRASVLGASSEEAKRVLREAEPQRRPCQL